MIGYLQGTVIHNTLKKIILQTTAGVGYEIYPTQNLLEISIDNAKLNIYIFTVVRENEITLYGFQYISEKELFTKLIEVSGIGPKIAIQIVSRPNQQICTAIEIEDVQWLTQIPGIGKKMAQKIILELKGKISITNLIDQKTSESTNQHLQEALSALQNLGYNSVDIQPVLQKAPNDCNTEEFIKYFLTKNI